MAQQNADTKTLAAGKKPKNNKTKKMQINAKNMLKKSQITGAHLNKLQAVRVEGESGTPPHGTDATAEVTDSQHIKPPTSSKGFVGASRW